MKNEVAYKLTEKLKEIEALLDAQLDVTMRYELGLIEFDEYHALEVELQAKIDVARHERKYLMVQCMDMLPVEEVRGLLDDVIDYLLMTGKTRTYTQYRIDTNVWGVKPKGEVVIGNYVPPTRRGGIDRWTKR